MGDQFEGMEKTRECPSRYFREKKKAFPKKLSFRYDPALPLPCDSTDCVVNIPALELGSPALLCPGGQATSLP